MKLVALVLIIILLGCSKNDVASENQTPGNILTSGPWYLSKYRTVKKDSANQVISDSTVVISGCQVDKPLILQNDSSASRDLSCFLTNTPILTGSWSLKADSSFYVILPYTRCSFATGCLQVNGGIDLSKMVELTPTSFTVMSSQQWQLCSPCVKQTHFEYSTFVRK